MPYAFQIKWLDEVDSTNNEIYRQIDSLDNLSVLSAWDQFAGRGQRGNKWSALPGENLTFSILLRPGMDVVPEVQVLDQFRVSEISTLAVKDLLSAHGIDSKVKWPNDIYVGNKKICGMLIENSLRGKEVSSSIIGIGINVNQTVFDPSLVNPTSMKKLSGESFPTEDLLEEFCSLFGNRIPLLSEYATLKEEYLSDLYRKDEIHPYRNLRTGEIFRGRIIDVDGTGLLVVDTLDGRVDKFSFKEIGYII
ncbi:MAG: biotin--[Bacteroidales bacterium]|nr:biotin--[acetyl-CoA-carboxylase] ligase [Bacteroidales bacterium]